jgi:hypothetical protein
MHMRSRHPIAQTRVGRITQRNDCPPTLEKMLMQSCRGQAKGRSQRYARNKNPATMGGVRTLVSSRVFSVSSCQFSLPRLAKVSPARANPRRASVAGSGTLTLSISDTN